MIVEVIVGGWEHECCGPEVVRGQSVAWVCCAFGDDGTLHETHHDLSETGGTRVQGGVAEVFALTPGGGRRRVSRVPSGAALCGNDPQDAGEIDDLEAGEPLTPAPEWFLVQIAARDAADDAS